MSITLADLRTRARERADMMNSTFIGDDELTAYINSSIAELHDLLVSCYGSDYFVKEQTPFSTVNGTSSYSLPTDFYKIKGVDVNLGGRWFSMKPFNFNERNRNVDISWGMMTGPSLRYRIIGDKIYFTPAPDGAYTVKLWYIPVATKLVANSDTFDDVNQYYEYVITDAAIKMLQKEESDVSVLMAQKVALTQRIQAMANNRDAEKADTVSDIYAENDEYWYFRTY